ncbi:MAG: hypothetical protein ACFFD1_00470 [Candidatus Thorarchaeota archaeon]
MGLDVNVVQKLLNELVVNGADYVVVADKSGLSIAVAVANQDDTETIETMGALTSIVIPQGEQIANYLGGGFQDTVIHTRSQTQRKCVLAFSLDTDPKTAILMICAPELEPQVVHGFDILKDKIINSLEGIAIEVRDNINDPYSGMTTENRRIGAFWDTLLTSVDKAVNPDAMKRVILDAKDNYMQIHGRFSPVLYQMNAYGNKINNNIENFEEFKLETKKQVQTWKKHALGIQEEEKKAETQESQENIS